jgi:hypothetical protein
LSKRSLVSWLDRWAAREQERVDRRARGSHPIPGDEPRWQRLAAAGLGGFNFFAGGVAYLALLVWGLVSLARHTVPSVVLGLVVTMMSVQLLVLRVYLIRVRLRAGCNAVTGLAPRRRAESNPSPNPLG